MFKGNIRSIQLGDAEMILKWRNQDSVRLNMYNHEVIDLDTHMKWFASILKSESCQYFIYEQNLKPLGVLSFSEIDKKNKKATWAFYSGDTTVRGVGSEMEQLALEYAFNKLDLNKLYCEVLEFNSAVINFHRKFGFKIEGIKRKDYLRDGQYYDIYQLALFKSDYLKTKNNNKYSIAKSYNWNFIISGCKVDEFAELSGDKNAIHLSSAHAVKLGFSERIVHGALIVAEISRIAAMEFPAKNAIYLSQKVDYKLPVYPNIELEGKAKLKTQIGRFVIIEYSIFQNEKMVVCCESEFLLSDEALKNEN